VRKQSFVNDSVFQIFILDPFLSVDSFFSFSAMPVIKRPNRPQEKEIEKSKGKEQEKEASEIPHLFTDFAWFPLPLDTHYALLAQKAKPELWGMPDNKFFVLDSYFIHTYIHTMKYYLFSPYFHYFLDFCSLR
jgi:hypothetical protein